MYPKNIEGVKAGDVMAICYSPSGYADRFTCKVTVARVLKRYVEIEWQTTSNGQPVTTVRKFRIDDGKETGEKFHSSYTYYYLLFYTPELEAELELDKNTKAAKHAVHNAQRKIEESLRYSDHWNLEKLNKVMAAMKLMAEACEISLEDEPKQS